MRMNARNTALRIAVTFMLAGAVGCATGIQTPEVVLPLPVERSPVSWTAPAVITNRLALGGESTSGSTLSSEEVLAAAIAFNPRMKLARAQRDLGAAGVQGARERVNPTFSISPEHLIAAATGVSPWVVAVSVVWPMRTAGKRRLAIEQALAADDAAALGAAAIIWSLRAEARATVCTAEFAWAHRELTTEEVALRTDLVSRLEKQSEAGLVSRYEVARARLDRDASTQKQKQSETDVLVARHDLAALTQLPMAEIEGRQPGEACINLPASEGATSTNDLEAEAIGSRLDLRAKVAEFRGSHAAWRAELAKRYPDVALGPGYMYDQGDRKLTFSLSLELPIHSRNGGGIARTRADRDRVIAEAEILQNTIAADVRKAADQLSAAHGQLDLARTLRAQAEALLSRDMDRERAGELDRPGVLLSRIATISARKDELTAAKLVFDAQTALESATQSPLAAPRFTTEAAMQILRTP